MHTKRRTRAAIGIGCLLVLSLSMGWFAGHYIPGEPKAPGSTIPPINFAQRMLEGSGYVANDTIDVQCGETANLTSITQGESFLWESRQPISASYTDEEGITHEVDEQIYIDSIKASGLWEYTCPSIATTLNDARIVSSRSFAEWYPEYDGMDKILTHSSVVLVTAALCNRSDTTLEYWTDLPTFTLWGDSLLCPANTMGAGIEMDAEAFSHLLSRTNDAPIETDTHSQFTIQPGETHEMVLPFLVEDYMLSDPTTFDKLDLSQFCIQTSDYKNATIYRLWLA
ncbi:MAG: hypothetical protein RR547_12845 [Raoultibacter sp.]